MEWRTIPSLGGAYEASDSGLIRRATASRGTQAGRLLSARPMVNGYWTCAAWAENKSRRRLVHRLVAEAFIGPCPIGHEVNHRNLDKADNSAANLEYVTRSENLLHRSAAGIGRGDRNAMAHLTEATVREIRARYRHGGGPGYKRLGRDYGVSWETVRDIISRRIWSWLA
jgi:hypothetical protein